MMPRAENDLLAGDSFGALLLGIISTLSRTDDALVAETAPLAESPTLDARDRLLLDALLGAVALRRTISIHLNGVPPTAPQPSPVEDWRGLASLRR